ncbi:helix-turn-helix domain-containing protein [Sinorhizobium terangae]|uniref:helix-turn-helix domain-containing protein n=2 Tax=Sinorhizobium terangae TaxID=110322 RepID=UPI00362AAF6C
MLAETSGRAMTRSISLRQSASARRRPITEHSEAATVAYAVGYESVSQFSREYKRLFGAPPRQNAGKLQNIIDPGP